MSTRDIVTAAGWPRAGAAMPHARDAHPRGVHDDRKELAAGHPRREAVPRSKKPSAPCVPGPLSLPRASYDGRTRRPTGTPPSMGSQRDACRWSLTHDGIEDAEKKGDCAWWCARGTWSGRETWRASQPCGPDAPYVQGGAVHLSGDLREEEARRNAHGEYKASPEGGGSTVPVQS